MANRYGLMLPLVARHMDPRTVPFPGLLVPGNIELAGRPAVKNPDGKISTIRSMSFEHEGREVLVPTVIGGKIVSDEEAIAHYHRTGQHLGIFESPETATAYGVWLHDREAERTRR